MTTQDTFIPSNEVFSKFKELDTLFLNQNHYHIKALQTDNGAE